MPTPTRLTRADLVRKWKDAALALGPYSPTLDTAVLIAASTEWGALQQAKLTRGAYDEIARIILED